MLSLHNVCALICIFSISLRTDLHVSRLKVEKRVTCTEQPPPRSVSSTTMLLVWWCHHPLHTRQFHSSLFSSVVSWWWREWIPSELSSRISWNSSPALRTPPLPQLLTCLTSAGLDSCCTCVTHFVFTLRFPTALKRPGVLHLEWKRGSHDEISNYLYYQFSCYLSDAERPYWD